MLPELEARSAIASGALEVVAAEGGAVAQASASVSPSRRCSSSRNSGSPSG
jgi:hypothetical protein